MKQISVSICGSDGSGHGHGDFGGGSDIWEVTDKQYAKIKEYIDNGEEDLLNMDVWGLKKRCRDIVKEIHYYAGCRGEDSEDYSVFIYVELVEEES